MAVLPSIAEMLRWTDADWFAWRRADHEEQHVEWLGWVEEDSAVLSATEGQHE